MKKKDMYIQEIISSLDTESHETIEQELMDMVSDGHFGYLIEGLNAIKNIVNDSENYKDSTSVPYGDTYISTNDPTFSSRAASKCYNIKLGLECEFRRNIQDIVSYLSSVEYFSDKRTSYDDLPAMRFEQKLLKHFDDQFKIEDYEHHLWM